MQIYQTPYNSFWNRRCYTVVKKLKRQGYRSMARLWPEDSILVFPEIVLFVAIFPLMFRTV